MPVSVPLGGQASLRLEAPAVSTQANPFDYRNRRPAPGDGGNAQGGLAGATLELGDSLTIGIGATSALDAVVCGHNGNPPQLVALSPPRTAVVEINGNALPISGPATVPLGIATLRLNQTITTKGGMTMRAVELDSPLLPTIVLGEAQVGYTGNPCAARGR